MPSQTFFNLPPEKQQTIMHVSRKEFSQYTFHEASINRIIKEAQISRGSFYMYFENKEDLFLYIMNAYQAKIMKPLFKQLQHENFDPYLFLLLIFDQLTSGEGFEEDKELFIGTVKKMNMEIASHLLNFMDPEELKKQTCLINKIGHDSVLNIACKEQARNFLELLKNMLISSIMSVFSGVCPIERARKDLEIRIQIVRYGIENLASKA
ncbi:TetR/AcrR family transcriptional regulator [Paenibacillus sp. 1001270B_150601_E10]|uniref:TetR/AcrR family transcriptional regulator n=1 Tax=Paenibacillus sp. 1001270B_150601_E10 TaxID=2787079 RepID=UPI00189F5D06|nr:TetR/AcrR family transcriptional regulator [Paenibacillus sp. 1001270B_150601_E10]